MKESKIILLTIFLLFVLVGCAKTDPAAQMVYDQIAEMKESGSYSLQDIEKAKERYNSLTDDQKKQVKNYADLLKMEDAYEDKLEADLAAAEHDMYYLPECGFPLPDTVSETKTINMEFEKRNDENVDLWAKAYYNSPKDAAKAFEDFCHSCSSLFPENYDEEGNKLTIGAYTSSNSYFGFGVKYK